MREQKLYLVSRETLRISALSFHKQQDKKMAPSIPQGQGLEKKNDSENFVKLPKCC